MKLIYAAMQSHTPLMESYQLSDPFNLSRRQGKGGR